MLQQFSRCIVYSSLVGGAVKDLVVFFLLCTSYRIDDDGPAGIVHREMAQLVHEWSVG